MNINLKQSLKKEVLQYMRDNDINVECVESIDLTKEEIKRGMKEGSIEAHFKYHIPMDFKEYSAMKINDKVIPVQEKVNA
jgi:hypothetical protein